MTGSTAERRQLAFDLLGDASFLAGREYAQALTLWRVMAAISFIGDDALQVDADLPGHLGHHLGQGVAGITVARQGRGMSDELPALAARDRRCHRNFEAEFIRLVGFAFTDAFHFRRVQAVNFRSTLLRLLRMNPLGQRQFCCKAARKSPLSLIVR
jgi:hypothetical protein